MDIEKELMKKLTAMEKGKSKEVTHKEILSLFKPKKEVFDWEKLLEFINKETGRNFQLINQKAKTKYKSVLKQGYTKEHIMSAIQNATKAQNHIDNGCQHLTPEFFSRPDKIDMYASPVAKNDSDRTVAPAMNKG